jgi:hypothetical protein
MMRNYGLAAAIAAALPLSAHAGAPAIEVQGRGVQIYLCAPAQAGFAWRLTAPDADLFDAAGHKVGHHFAGPSWQANDGSTVTGEVISSNAAPMPGVIPWLLLRAKSHAGAGVFTAVSFIARVDTRGGAAPGGGCDRAHAGATRRVPYAATYILLPGA